jgi:hypothetical protein
MAPTRDMPKNNCMFLQDYKIFFRLPAIKNARISAVGELLSVGQYCPLTRSLVY